MVYLLILLPFIFFVNDAISRRWITHPSSDREWDRETNMNTTYDDDLSVESKDEDAGAERRRMKDITPEDHLISGLPLVSAADFPTKHYSGLLPIPDRGQMFYWLFESTKTTPDTPLLIWLNGGPGASSMEGLFLECGPFQFNIDEPPAYQTQLRMNPHSWHHMGHLLFVDQPIGTGLSVVNNRRSYAKSNAQVAQQFDTFLRSFLQIYRHLFLLPENSLKTREIYILGESHAGRYIPTMVRHILEQNTRSQVEIHVAGIALGNAWIHPSVQYDYSDFAHGLGYVSVGQKRQLKHAFQRCQENLSRGRLNTAICFENMDTIVRGMKTPQGLGLNVYDVRSTFLKKQQKYPIGTTYMTAYLNRQDVQQALHITHRHAFVESSNPVYSALVHEDGLSTLADVEAILDRSIPVLVYNGQWDFMCNHVSTEKVLVFMNWTNARAYQEAARYTWFTPTLDRPSGFVKEGGGLSFVIVAESGHMVPMDAPVSAFDLMQRFVSHKSLRDQISLVKVIPTNASSYESQECSSSIVMHQDMPTLSPVVGDLESQDLESQVYLLPTSSWLWILMFSMVFTAVVSVKLAHSSPRYRMYQEARLDEGDDTMTTAVSEADDDDDDDDNTVVI